MKFGEDVMLPSNIYIHLGLYDPHFIERLRCAHKRGLNAWCRYDFTPLAIPQAVEHFFYTTT